MSIHTLEQDGDVGELRRISRESDSSAVRERAVEALGTLGSEWARQWLLPLLDEVDDDEVRGQTLAALSSLGGTLEEAPGRQLGGTEP